ncbi:CoA transferase [Virgibacillus sp. NKC19-3]|uniref:CaiB/BaiF CoA transferase family protein n=1 Tax=Virgibacillus saliphilus TaxID=2831674 RepID=UPI001C9B1F8A|nr:CaiB/BaiF CoA-transferase family protein [Virgibacillus sp. NKC19-3]MBY7144505.1 CoA transferase [Virgibacillus sp. NKC19-3]
MRQALEDIKIIDLSRVFAGPAGSMVLGDLGADVIRVEAPQGTDSIREWSPYVNNESTYYLSANRNKRAITINLKSETGKKIFYEIVKTADVVLENFKTGTMDRLGLGYAALQKINPKIIMCSVTGYGQTGPFAQEPGFDPVLQAVGGLMDVTGDPDGEATRVGLPVVDIMSSLYTAISILSAIRARDLYGEGQQIDISLLDVQVSSLANVASSYLMKGHLSQRMGNNHNNIVPYQVFHCKDKPLMVACGNDNQFSTFCEVLGRPEWSKDEKFRTNANRVENRDELSEKIKTIMVTKNAEEWFDLLSEKSVPSGPVNNIKEVFEHPQVKARQMVEEVPHPTLGKVKLVRNPLRFSKMATSVQNHPPLLGEHTIQYLQEELGLSLEEIQRLKKEGAI